VSVYAIGVIVWGAGAWFLVKHLVS
jgi:hypothetical protein